MHFQPIFWSQLFALLTACLIQANCTCQDSTAAQSAPVKSTSTQSAATIQRLDKKPIELPGLLVDFQNQCIDLEATVCLEKGWLELVACTPGSKEHESLVVVRARPIHIHTALLLLGLKNGNPAIRKQIGQENPRWIDLPPRGDSVQLFLVVENNRKQWIERPIDAFLSFADQPMQQRKVKTGSKVQPEAGPSELAGNRSRHFPKHFLFTGSQLVENGKGPRQYLAEESGNVISIATFGDELIGLPEVHSHSNQSLMWRIKPGQLPKVGTTIKLRIRPVKKAAKKTNKRRQSKLKSKSQPHQRSEQVVQPKK